MIATVVRVKTLTSLGQLDGKRKGHIVRFLYKAQMITVGQPEVDLTDADFTSVTVILSTWFDVKGNNTIFNDAIMRYANFTHFRLINASVVEIHFFPVNMNNTLFDKVNFTGANLRGASFAYANLFGSIFDRSDATVARFYSTKLEGTKWIDTIVNNVDFSQANLSNASITDWQIQRAWKTFHIILPNGIKGSDTNLLQNGDAEGQNTRCKTSPWHVNSMFTEKYDKTHSYIYGQCYFTKQSNITQGTMWERFQIPNE